MARILVIDDDIDLTAVINGWLTADSHSVKLVHNGLEGLEHLRQGQYDIVLLDWQLPDLSGLEILQTFRNEKGLTPVIMLTGIASLEAKEAGLNVGADDYLTKPFYMKELVARIRALLRRTIGAASNILQIGNLVLDQSKHMVLKGNIEIALSIEEFALLEFLMRYPDDVFSAESLLQRVWHADSEATVEGIRTCIKRLRQKLGQNDDDSLIQSVARIGYKLKPD